MGVGVDSWSLLMTSQATSREIIVLGSPVLSVWCELFKNYALVLFGYLASQALLTMRTMRGIFYFARLCFSLLLRAP